MSQEVRGQVQQGLLGLDGQVTPRKIKLDTYFKMPALPHAKLDVLAWWKVQEPVLPLLVEISTKYLCIPASSAPSVRLFSQPQEMSAPGWGVPWIPPIWRWLSFSMKIWRKSKWPMTAPLLQTLETKLLASLLTLWSTLIEMIVDCSLSFYLSTINCIQNPENRKEKSN